MKRKFMIGLFGFVLGFCVSSIFSIPDLLAQHATWAQGERLQQNPMESAIPKSYGDLKAVSGIEMYFQGEDGTIYIVEPRTAEKLKTEVKVIHRN